MDSEDERGGGAARPISPLWEFDSDRVAVIEPSQVHAGRDVPPACVVTFFGEVVDRLLAEGGRLIDENRWEDGPHRLIEIEHDGQRLAVLHSGVGSPLAVGLLEDVIAYGCRAFVVCGGAGALRSDLTLGHLVVVTSAVRDEGTSAHYLPAGWVIESDPNAVEILTATLDEGGVPYVVGRSWTTDAIYRETPARVASRQSEGCLTVEMEASALAAVARFRGVPLAQVLYCGDDLSGETWDSRDWQGQGHVRESLVKLAATAVLRLAAANG